jgi:hypothetical protein
LLSIILSAATPYIDQPRELVAVLEVREGRGERRDRE